MKYSQISPFVLIASFFLASCSNVDKDPQEKQSEVDFDDSTLMAIYEEVDPNLEIKEGVVCTTEQTFRVMRGDNPVAIVKISDPIIVAQAEKEETWGYFQFPIIYRNENNYLVVKYQMRADSQTDYGKSLFGYRMSVDEGESWTQLDKDYLVKERYRVEMNNGDVLQVKDVPNFDKCQYEDFPKAVNNLPLNGYDFYKESELPEDLRGVYFDFIGNGKDKNTIHASIDDIGYLRYGLNNMISIVWWGDIRQTANGNLIAGVYPTFYQDVDGNVLNTTTSFYKSSDKGRNWKLLGVIPHQKVNGVSKLFDGSDGYCEPTFEVLNDGTFICVMRTGSRSPMVRSFSLDGGAHWSEPEPFASNGVMPNLLLLENGSLVLASGRPGIQLRFSIDGDGKNWTEPIEMLPIMEEHGEVDIWGATCGYPSLIQVSDNTFYVVYSDFKTINEKGENRKSIMFRKCTVINRS